MTIRIYNSLSRRKEIFEPGENNKVRMYVCGPTVYDSCHIGHARSVVVFDMIYRYLDARGYEVFYVRNFTDVDDKIIARANEAGVSCDEISEKYIREFHEDMAHLNMLPPTMEPRATAHIDQIINIIAILIDKGYAYIVDGDVYFSVEKYRDYGKLSGRRLEDMVAGSRVEIDPRKKNPYDFVLWKASKPQEPQWDSPWGKGRPGWHIECSAMSAEYLGQTFDIHGGGKDLIFPHHENEIAQSEAAFGRTFVKYWVHNGFINIDQEKMSKSLGNFLTIREIVKIWHPEALRLFLLSNHYRSPLDYTDQAMHEATAGMDRIYAMMMRVEQYLDRKLSRIHLQDKQVALSDDTDTRRLFLEAMDDDFNTARAIGILFDSVRNINRMIDADETSSTRASQDRITGEVVDILQIGKILGIANLPPDVYFQQKLEKGTGLRKIDPSWVEEKIRMRKQARQNKDFAAADRIRDELLALDVILEDRPDGTIWKMKQ
ncbi:MAG: cysteine--tRNA ligase [Desulfosalsimonadaceae bacterium]